MFNLFKKGGIAVETKNSSDKKKKTPSAIIEFRLLENQKDYKELLKLQDLGRILYNACLGESLRRLKLVKAHKLYKETIAIPKDTKENKDKRNLNFKFLNNKYGFTNASIQSFAVKCKNKSKFLNQLGVHVIQKLATRAFHAVQKVAFGKAKKVKFKKKGDFVSLEGKNNTTFLRYSNAFALIGDMTIKCKIRKNDPYFEHFLKHRIKFCRLVSRRFNNKYKFFLQVVFEGSPYKKVKLGDSHTSTSQARIPLPQRASARRWGRNCYFFYEFLLNNIQYLCYNANILKYINEEVK